MLGLGSHRDFKTVSAPERKGWFSMGPQLLVEGHMRLAKQENKSCCSLSVQEEKLK